MQANWLDVSEIALQLDYDRLLNDREREVMDLVYWSDFTQKEVGRFLGISESKVQRTVADSLNKLRLAYDELI